MIDKLFVVISMKLLLHNVNVKSYFLSYIDNYQVYLS